VEICRSVCLRMAIDIDEGVDERIAARAFLPVGLSKKTSKR
jgi:hypothetical protein